MRRALTPTVPDRSPCCRRLVFWLLAALVAPGCHNEAETDYSSASEPPTVRLIHPSVRNIVRVVGQPSFIESYERTSIYPKLTGYIEKWIVDIGDKVKKGQVLATLFVPETVEDFGTKKATVELDKERVELALKLVKVAEADVETAKALAPTVVRVLQLRTLARQQPERPATEVLPQEVVHLVALKTGGEAASLTVEQCVKRIAQLGGYQGRRSVCRRKTLWHGWLKIQTLLEGVHLAHQVLLE